MQKPHDFDKRLPDAVLVAQIGHQVPILTEKPSSSGRTEKSRWGFFFLNSDSSVETLEQKPSADEHCGRGLRCGQEPVGEACCRRRVSVGWIGSESLGLQPSTLDGS